MKTRTIGKPATAALNTRAIRKPAKKVCFNITSATAKSVALVGSFTEWERKPIPLVELETGRWEVEVELPSGRHEYLFLTDQREWLRDPDAIQSTPNPCSELNCVIEVDPPA